MKKIKLIITSLLMIVIMIAINTSSIDAAVISNFKTNNNKNYKLNSRTNQFTNELASGKTVHVYYKLNSKDKTVINAHKGAIQKMNKVMGKNSKLKLYYGKPKVKHYTVNVDYTNSRIEGCTPKSEKVAACAFGNKQIKIKKVAKDWNMEAIFVHEILHTLGFSHTSNKNSILHANYGQRKNVPLNFNKLPNDKSLLQTLAKPVRSSTKTNKKKKTKTITTKIFNTYVSQQRYYKNNKLTSINDYKFKTGQVRKNTKKINRVQYYVLENHIIQTQKTVSNYHYVNKKAFLKKRSIYNSNKLSEVRDYKVSKGKNKLIKITKYNNGKVNKVTKY